MHLVTPLISHIVNNPDYGKKELESVEMVLAGAAPVGKSIINRFLEKAEKYIIYREGYGMTELSPVSHLVSPKTNNSKIGSCGQGLSDTYTKIVDIVTGKTVGRNERGEICVKGPQVSELAS
jgi:acyl-CoA synthetase (AMP-forming)/AMP-acid ligase II